MSSQVVIQLKAFMTYNFPSKTYTKKHMWNQWMDKSNLIIQSTLLIWCKGTIFLTCLILAGFLMKMNTRQCHIRGWMLLLTILMMITWLWISQSLGKLTKFWSEKLFSSSIQTSMSQKFILQIRTKQKFWTEKQDSRSLTCNWHYSNKWRIHNTIELMKQDKTKVLRGIIFNSYTLLACSFSYFSVHLEDTVAVRSITL